MRWLNSAIDTEIAEAVAFAEAGAWEPIETLTGHVRAEDRDAPPVATEPVEETVEETVERSYREAVKQSIREAMAKDERVFLMG